MYNPPLPFTLAVCKVIFQASGQARPSFVSAALGNVDENHDINHQREVIKNIAGISFAGIPSSGT